MSTIETVYLEASKLTKAGNFADALPLLEQLRAAVPGAPQIHNDLGVAYFKCGRPDDAMRCYQDGIMLSPYMAMAYQNLGVLLSKTGRHGEALAYFSFASALDPKAVGPYINMCDSYCKLSNFEFAEKVIANGLKIDPDNVDALSNMATTQWGLGKIDEALAYYEKAHTKDPENATIKKNIGIIQLLRGNLTEGWAGYEARKKADNYPNEFFNRQWDGKTEGYVAVRMEQGLGDQILHASMVNDMPNQFVWQVDRRLVSLLQRSFPTKQFIPDDQPIGDHFAHYTQNGSLAQWLRPSPETIKGTPYLVADPAKIRAMQRRLPETGTNIGISWASIGTEFASNKMCPLDQWGAVLSRYDLNFVNLQYGAGAREVRGTRLYDVGIDNKDDLDSLAGLIMACDLVITISNTTAHLAAALGRETWLLVPNGWGKFWYWGLDGDKTPWYSAIRIFRQREATWTTVMGQVAQALEQRYPNPVAQLQLSGLGQLSELQLTAS